MGKKVWVTQSILLLEVIFEIRDGFFHSWKHAEHSSYTNSITINSFSNKMETQLEIINRFVGIIGSGDNVNDRLQTEWSYLYKLLRSPPIAYDRIEAYLSILQQQDGKKSRGARNSNSSL